MTLALLALLAFAAALLLGVWRADLNVGLLALALTFALGTWGAGWDAARVAALFPSSLVLTVVGVSFFFGIAHQNGTLERVTSTLLRFAGSGARRLPAVFFALAFALSALGPGNIAAVALLAPVAMPAAIAARASPLLTAIALCTGANAGAFSPAAVTGGLNTALMRGVGLVDPGAPLVVFGAVAALQAASALLAFALLARRPTGEARASPDAPRTPAARPLEPRHRLTLALIALFLALVLFARVDAATAAFSLSAVLTVARAGDTDATVRALPWGTVLLVGGAGSLANLLGATGGLDLVAEGLARVAPSGMLHATLAFAAGLASVPSSSSGVVMPLLVPLAPDLVARAGEGSALSAVVAIDAGAHLVDASPLSTLGALCLAALPGGADGARVFRALLAWGLAMTPVAALLAWLLLDLPG